jgi:hypothetical protein
MGRVSIWRFGPIQPPHSEDDEGDGNKGKKGKGVLTHRPHEAEGDARRAPPDKETFVKGGSGEQQDDKEY